MSHRLIAFLCAVFAAACSQDVARELRDEALESRILEAGKARRTDPVASFAAPHLLICVLRPYQEDVRPKGSEAVAEINRQLSQAKYVSGDDHWAVVAYEPGKPIRVAVISQGTLQMARAQKELCEPAAALRVAYNADGQVALVKD